MYELLIWEKLNYGKKIPFHKNQIIEVNNITHFLQWIIDNIMNKLIDIE